MRLQTCMTSSLTSPMSHGCWLQHSGDRSHSPACSNDPMTKDARAARWRQWGGRMVVPAASVVRTAGVISSLEQSSAEASGHAQLIGCALEISQI